MRVFIENRPGVWYRLPMILERDKTLWEVMLGKREADLLIEDGRFLNPVSQEMIRGSLAVCHGRIAGWGKVPAKRIMHAGGAVVTPGLIDAHIHVESSMLTPREFARAVIPHGTTAVVADPHEVANVAGIEGVRWMIDQGNLSPLRFFWAAPSCVPASSLDTPGFVLDVPEVEKLLDQEEVVSLGEVMNYPGVIFGEPSVVGKITAAVTRGKVVDGHAPGLTGRELFAYVAAGVETDHECTTLEEAEEKLRSGMFIQMRQGSSAHNLEALHPLMQGPWIDRLLLATDDKNPMDLSEKGHLDEPLRMCVQRGIPPEKALRAATLNPARVYRLRGLGMLAPGNWADLVFFEDLKEFRVNRVLIGGEVVYEQGKLYEPGETDPVMPTPSMRVKAFSPDSLRIRREGDTMKVIGILPGQLLTEKLVVPVPGGDEVSADPEQDILKVAVFERHHETGNVGVGFVRGFGFKQGALATTVAHDSHHLIVVGTRDEDMLMAVKTAIDIQGGAVVVRDGAVLATMPLPVYGLMSDQPLQKAAETFRDVHGAAKSLGSLLMDPLMQLSFLALPVIPSLKITDQGLVDVDKFQHVSLFGE